MSLCELNRPLLDKVTIGRFSIVGIDDVDGLSRKEAVKVTANHFAEKQVVLPDGQFFTSLTIGKNTLFDRLTYKANPKTGHGSGRIDLSIGGEGTLHNLVGYTPEQYQTRIRQIQDFLDEEYGIQADFSEACYTSMEIAKTFPIEEPFRKYVRPFIQMMVIFPRRYRMAEMDCLRNIKDIREVGSFYRKSSAKGTGLQIKIYDKTAQLKKQYGLSIDQSIVRYEITLEAPRIIRTHLGRDSVWKLTAKDINTYFNDFIRKTLIEANAEYVKERDKVLKRLLKEQYASGNRRWVNDVIAYLLNKQIASNGVPSILDISELTSLLVEIPQMNKQARYRAKQRFVKEAKRLNLIYDSGDGARFEELQRKLIS